MIDEIDETTRAQILTFLDHPAFAGSRIAVMPDCHAGKGAVIGLTMELNGYVIPNVIGVDIGCGVLAARFAAERLDPAALDRFIRARIPSGFQVNREAEGVEAGLAAGKDTLDEAPQAYKDGETILAGIRETVEVDDWVRPVYNFKAGSD